MDVFEQGDDIRTVLQEVVLILNTQGGARQGSLTSLTSGEPEWACEGGTWRVFVNDKSGGKLVTGW